jgi:hypothetical protein
MNTLSQARLSYSIIMRVLDPRIHPLRKKFLQRWMDCRVEPGNDDLNLAPERFRADERMLRGSCAIRHLKARPAFP